MNYFIFFVVIVMSGSLFADTQIDSATALTESKNVKKWKEWTKRVHSGRQELDAWIFYDSYNELDEKKLIYLTRNKRGNGINKLSGHKEKPENLNKDTNLLGYVAPDHQEKGFNFFPMHGQPQALNMDAITVIKSLNMGLWIYEDEGKYYLDVYNYERPFAELYKNPQFFAYNNQWRVFAKFMENREELTTPASNGEEWEDVRLGFVEFQYKGQSLKVAVYEYDDFNNLEGEVQLRFGDQGNKTYPGGRYLYVKIKDLKNPDGFWLDFNYAYDPPCAWSQSYNCSLVRTDEILPVELNAGYIYPLNNIY